MRSSWKGAFVNPIIYPHFVESKSKKFKNKNVIVCSRDSAILDCMVGKTLSIYNGLKYMPLLIKSSMVGFKAGSFIFTKKTGSRIHTNKNKKNRK